MKKVIMRSLLAGTALVAATPSLAQYKNVIVMVADGAGANMVDAARMWSGGPLAMDNSGWVSTYQSVYPLRTNGTPGSTVQDPNAVYDPAKNWNTTPVSGTTGGYPRGFAGYDWARSTAPDSGNTASSMATGVKGYNNSINVDGAGNALPTIAELAKSYGKSTGVVSTVQFSDATPAAFGGAHNTSRSNRQAIAAEMFNSGTLDVIAGAGNPDYNNNGQLRSTADYSWVSQSQWDALKSGSTDWQLVQDRATIEGIANGSVVANDKLAMIMQGFDGINAYRTGSTGGLTASDTYSPFTDALNSTAASLSDISLAALSVLGRNPEGFYMAIEQGEVDRAMHSNNLGRAIESYMDFNKSILSVMDWVNRADTDADWSNTLLVVTADHDHMLFGPDGATDPFQGLVDNGAGNLPGHDWLGSGHSNQLIPLFAYGAGADGIGLMADQVDRYIDANGREWGRGNYTDQAELGRYLMGNLANTAAVPEPATWAMMIGGFALVGTSMRRRRAKIAFA